MYKDSPCAVKTKMKMAIALKELMNSNSFEKITVSDITEKCMVHRQTFYYHFQDRYELLDWLIYTELLEPFMNDINLDNMYEKFKTLFTVMAKDKRFYQTALKMNTGDIMGFVSRVANEQLANALRVLGRENEIVISSENDNSLIAEFFGYGFSGVVMSWSQRGMKESPEEMTNEIINLVNVCKQIIISRNR